MQITVENSDYAVEYTAVNMDVAVSPQAEINVAVGDAARIDVGEAINYIKSGQAEIQNYVDNTAKPDIYNYVENVSKPSISNYIENVSKPAINSYVNNTAIPAVSDYVDNTAKPAIDAYVTNTVEPQLDNYVDLAKDWATKTDGTVDGVEYSAKYYANQAAALFVTLAPVATSGSYNDLTDKPTIPTKTSDLTNDSGFITSASLSGYATQTWVGQQGYITGITSSDVTTALGYTPYDSSNPSNYQTATQVANSIATETTNRENADNNLQSQIDAIVSSSDVFDIVGTYAELQAYDITTVPVNDIIKVLVDSTHSGAATYYRCVETGGVKSWSYIGSEGAYYTKAEADAAFVPQTRTINSKALSANITLTATDVGADASGAASTAETNAKNYADGLGANYATAAQGALADTALQPNDNISELNNNVGYITSSALSGKQDTLVSGTNIKTINNQSVLGSGNITIGGAVDSVNGYTGTVVLAPSDLGITEYTAQEVETLWGSL